jgi:hypothetical protein
LVRRSLSYRVKPNHPNVNKRTTFLISWIRFTYKFVILNIKRKQNNFFGFFWNIGQVLVTLINWLLKPKCMLKHIFFFEDFFVVWKYNIIVFAFRDLVVCMKTKTCFFFMFWWKLGILISDLYFYGLKIQTDISQNSVK